MVGVEEGFAWLHALHRIGLRASFGEFDLLYHVSSPPLIPVEYAMPGLAGITFRLEWEPERPPLLATCVDPVGVDRIGRRLGLAFEEALAFVDSHERVHAHLQLAGTPTEREEDASRVVDATVLSMWREDAARLLGDRPIALVTRVGDEFWEALARPIAEDDAEAGGNA